MEILQIPSSEAENVFDFFAERDRSSNIFKRGLDNLVLDYDSGKYFYFIASEKEKILGHGGIYKKEDLCVLENLSFEPTYKASDILADTKYTS